MVSPEEKQRRTQLWQAELAKRQQEQTKARLQQSQAVRQAQGPQRPLQQIAQTEQKINDSQEKEKEEESRLRYIARRAWGATKNYVTSGNAMKHAQAVGQAGKGVVVSGAAGVAGGYALAKRGARGAATGAINGAQAVGRGISKTAQATIGLYDFISKNPLIFWLFFVGVWAYDFFFWNFSNSPQRIFFYLALAVGFGLISLASSHKESKEILISIAKLALVIAVLSVILTQQLVQYLDKIKILPAASFAIIYFVLLFVLAFTLLDESFKIPLILSMFAIGLPVVGHFFPKQPVIDFLILFAPPWAIYAMITQYQNSKFIRFVANVAIICLLLIGVYASVTNAQMKRAASDLSQITYTPNVAATTKATKTALMGGWNWMLNAPNNTQTAVNNWQSGVIYTATGGDYIDGEQEKTKEFIGLELQTPTIPNKKYYKEDETGDFEVNARIVSYNPDSQMKLSFSCEARKPYGCDEDCRNIQKGNAVPAEMTSEKRLSETVTCYPSLPEKGHNEVKIYAKATDFSSAAYLTNNFVDKESYNAKIEEYVQQRGVEMKDEQDEINAVRAIYPIKSEPLSRSGSGPLKVIMVTKKTPVIGIDEESIVDFYVGIENTGSGKIDSIKSLEITYPDGLEPTENCKAFTASEKISGSAKTGAAIAGRAGTLVSTTLSKIDYSKITKGEQASFPSCKFKIKDIKKLLINPNQPNPRDFEAKIKYDYTVSYSFDLQWGEEPEATGSGLFESGSGTCSGFTPDKNNLPPEDARSGFEKYKNTIMQYAGQNTPSGMDSTSFAALIATVAQKESSFNNRCASYGKSMLTGCGWPPSCASGCACDNEHVGSDDAQIKCTSETLKNNYDNPESSESYKSCASMSGNERWKCIFKIYRGESDAAQEAYAQETFDFWAKWKNYLCEDAKSASKRNDFSGKCSQILNKANEYLGCPYVKNEDGGVAPSSPSECGGNHGFTCATFVMTVLRQSSGIEISGNGNELCDNAIAEGKAIEISKSQLQPGDIISKKSGAYGHVMIYYGGGQVIHATTISGYNAVVVSQLDEALVNADTTYCRLKGCI